MENLIEKEIGDITAELLADYGGGRYIKEYPR